MGQTYGIDVVEVRRIKAAAQNEGGPLNDLFTPAELSACFARRRPYARLAACLAVKEALLKAAGIGLREGLRFTEIEVVNPESGSSLLRLTGQMSEIIGDVTGSRCLVSSAFTDDLACAAVALQQ